MGKKIKWNDRITESVERMGGKQAEMVGCYYVNDVLVDLTASGNKDWQIAKNILIQIDEFYTTK